MAFVLDDVINEIEETRSLESLKKLKKEIVYRPACQKGPKNWICFTPLHKRFEGVI